MLITKLIKADENPEVYNLAQEFLKPYEKKFCSLMNRVLDKENSVYVILKKEIPSCRSKVMGVFSYNSGKSFTSCIPVFNKKIELILENFFRSHEIYCLVGEKVNVEKVEQIYFKIKKAVPSEARAMYLMEYTGKDVSEKISSNQNLAEENAEIISCSPKNEEQLFPLHLNYVQVEVLPEWKKLNPALERLNLEKILSTQFVGAVYRKSENKILCKAQTNAHGINTVQLGGVFTEESERKKGFASSLIHFLAKKFFDEGKEVILFVRKNNPGAIKAYEKAGLKIFEDYKMDYYL